MNLCIAYPFLHPLEGKWFQTQISGQNSISQLKVIFYCMNFSNVLLFPPENQDQTHRIYTFSKTNLHLHVITEHLNLVSSATVSFIKEVIWIGYVLCWVLDKQLKFLHKLILWSLFSVKDQMECSLFTFNLSQLLVLKQYLEFQILLGQRHLHVQQNQFAYRPATGCIDAITALKETVMY